MRLRLTLTLTLPMMISAAVGFCVRNAVFSKTVFATLAHESDKAHKAGAARPSRERAWAWRAPNDPHCQQ